MKFLGVIASIYAGFRVARNWAWGKGGVALGMFGVFFTLASDIGPMVAIIGAIWLHQSLGNREGVTEMDLLDTEKDVRETPSYQTPSTEEDRMDDWSREMKTGTDEWSGDDQMATGSTGGAESGGGNWDPPEESSGPSTGDTDGSTDDEFDGRDPYNIEW